MTEVVGVPVIVGAVFVCTACTVIENAARDAEACPSLTLITMPPKVPTLLADGVPLRRPVLLSKLAQAGRFAIEKVRTSPFESLADGVKAYEWF